MIRIILETIYLLSLIYLSLLYYKLFKNVVHIRRKTKTSLGYDTEKLQRAVRAHSNFCETVPIVLILSFVLYFNNLLYFAVPIVLILLIGRTIHYKAISELNEDLEKRVNGMKLTIYSIKLAILGICYYIFQLIYYGIISSTKINYL